MLRRILWTVPALLFALAGRAHAGEGPTDPSPSVEGAEELTETHWYGGRLLLADGASLAVLAAGGSLRSTPVFLAGFAGWFLASPIAHAEHAGLGRGAASLVLRVGLPALGLLAGQSSANGCWREVGASDSCEVGAGAGGLLLGAIAAEIIDVALFARDAHAAAPRPSREQAFAEPVVVPAAGGGAVMGLAGRF